MKKVIVFLKSPKDTSMTFEDVNEFVYHNKIVTITHGKNNIKSHVPIINILVIEEHETKETSEIHDYDIVKIIEQPKDKFWKPDEDPKDRMIVAMYGVFSQYQPYYSAPIDLVVTEEEKEKDDD